MRPDRRTCLSQAAELRRKYQFGTCPESDAANREAEQAAKDDEVSKGTEVITIEDEDDEPDVWILNDDELPHFPPAPVKAEEEGKGGKKPVVRAEVITVDSGSESDDEPIIVGQKGVPPSKRSRTDAHQSDWFCSGCTLRNSPRALRCSACDTERPRSTTLDQSKRKQILRSSKNKKKEESSTVVTAPSGWQCSNCGFQMVGDLAQFWACRTCWQIRQSSSSTS